MRLFKKILGIVAILSAMIGGLLLMGMNFVQAFIGTLLVLMTLVICILLAIFLHWCFD